MKTTNTESQIKAIATALEKIHVRTFQYESGDAKSNAQRNLRGKTHYVDEDTLRWHKSRICSTAVLHGGLLFRVTCSDALDPDNRKRGFRSAVFDVFGTIVSRPKLDEAKSTSEAAINASNKEEINLVQHYRKEIKSQIEWKRRDIADRKAALAAMPR